MALAAAKLGDGAQHHGIVDRRVTSAGGDPVLVGAVDVPERHLHGTVALRRDTAPGGPAGLVATVDFGLPAAVEPGRLWISEAPTLCGGTDCVPFFTPAVEGDDGQGKRQFRVRAAWGDNFRLRMEDRLRLLTPLSSDGDARGWVTASRTVLPEGTLPPRPGATILLGSIEVPAAGLRLSLEAGLAPRGSEGGVAAALRLVPDADRFGPVTVTAVEPIEEGGHIAMVGSARVRRSGGYDLTLAAPAHIPTDAMLADARLLPS